MQIHRDDVIDSSNRQEVGDHSPGNCPTMRFLLRLPGVWKVSCIFLSPDLFTQRYFEDIRHDS